MKRLLTRSDVLLPLVALVAAVAAFALVPVYSGQQLAVFNVFFTLQGFSNLALITLGFGLVIIAGEFDLSIVGVYALSGVIAVDLGEHQPLVGLVAAVAICTAFGTLQGLVIAKLRIPSMPVTLGTFIALLGLTLSLGHGDLSLTFNNVAASLWFQSAVFHVLSPQSIITIIVFIVIGVLMSVTRWGREVRAIGSDRVSSRTAGVPVDRLLVGLFATSAALGALGGVLVTFSTASASTNPGTDPMIFGITGALIGGVSLRGGRGTVAGMFAGALVIAILQQIFEITSYAGYITEFIFGAALFVVVAVDAPGLRASVVRVRSRRSVQPSSR